MTDDSCQASASRQIAAPAEEIFRILADPTRHPDIDGAELLKDASGNSIISAIGDTFTVRMYSEQMRNYETTNHVVEYERDRRIAWEPVISGVTLPEDEWVIGDRLGQRWTYALEPIDSRTTLVTETYDCTRSPEWVRVQVRNGDHWAKGMAKTLENLERQVISAQRSARRSWPR